jgi:hypothetical protein
MKNFRNTIILFLLIKAFVVNSQTDLFVDPSSLGLTFLDGKKIEDCNVCKEDFTALDEKIDKLGKNPSVNSVVELLQAEFDNETVNNRKARILLIMIRYLVESENEIPDVIYHFSQYENEDIENENGFFENKDFEKARKGAMEILALFDRAIDLAEDENSKNNLKINRMYYITSTDLFEELNHIYGLNTNISVDENIETFEVRGTDKIILETLNNDYISTGIVPFKAYDGINLGLNYLQGRNNWLGSEISFDFVDHPNPFRLISPLSNTMNGHYSLLGFGFLKNLTQQSFDVNGYVLNVRKLGIFNANLFQFGYHKGYSTGNSWFYRPEIGLTYGPISISYGYNAIFKKSVRPFTESHFVTIKLNYPFIRISKYY